MTSPPDGIELDPRQPESWRLVRRCVLLIAGLQFFVVLEGSILLPIGPVLSAALRFPTSDLGYLNSIFLFAAAGAGLVGSLVLDRFDRRRVLCVALLGLALTTALAAAAQSVAALMACRAVAGLCGGPAAAVGLAIVGDVTAPGMRARAMGVVAAGSSLSLIIGVPLALALADATGWRPMFVLIGALGFALAGVAAVSIPAGLAVRRRQSARQALREFAGMLSAEGALLLLAMTALVFAAIHMLAANLATFLVVNLGSPIADLKYIWMVGGLAGLASSQVTSRLADRYGAVPVFWAASVFSIVTSYLFFVEQPVVLPGTLLFSGYLVSVNSRVVLAQTMSSLVSQPATRGRFMSLAGASNQAASGAMLLVGSAVLSSDADGALLHMDVLGAIGIGTTVVSLGIAAALHRRVASLRRRPPSGA